MTTNYARARSFEYRVRDDMLARGYAVVRSAGSRTPVDIYCFDCESKIFIQCKTNGRLDAKEWNRFYDYCKSVDAVPILAEMGRRGGIRYSLLTGRKVPYKRNQTVDWIPLEGVRNEIQKSDAE